MKKIRIYGASDDLIEVEGDLMAEGSPRHDQPGYVVLSTGDVFSLEFTDENDGIWRVRHSIITGKLSVNIAPPTVYEYSDSAHVEGPIEWICIYQSWPIDEDELGDLLEEAIERASLRGRFRLPRERLIAAIEAITGKPLLGGKL